MPSFAERITTTINWINSRFADIDKLPFSIRILRRPCCEPQTAATVTAEDVERLAGWSPQMTEPFEVPFKPGRVILQDFTGVPAVVDLAAMRAAMARLGGKPDRINPIVPVDLVIDHPQVDQFGSAFALFYNAERASSSGTASATSSSNGVRARSRTFGRPPPRALSTR